MAFSTENESKFLALCEKLKNCEEKNPWRPIFKNIESPQSLSFEILEEMDIGGNLQHNPLTTNTLNEITRSAEQSLCTVVCNSEKGQIDFGSSIDEDKVLKLKNALSNVSEGRFAEDNELDFGLFQCIPASSIPLLCSKLEIHFMSELAIEALLKGLSCMDQPICLSSATAFVQNAVCPRVIGLKSSASRSLITSITVFTECYPRAIIEGIFLSCLDSNANGPFQTDILVQIIKCNLPDDLIFLCQRKCIEVSEVNENTFHLMQCIIEKQALQNNDFYDVLLRKLKSWSLSYNSNLKFTKLLITVATIFGSKMNGNQLAILKEIIKNNTTLLRKAAENVLNKIKK